ncbi:hypothetical protein JYU34_001691 [Plutella xylostella]|uniref:Uncharacterized protein n=1 Tax=Plutella xylostella TaxID=51655 RepID=A0ABQ7R4I7_PLUXY|nr:hypothetical protein JYU34_001691 [Plutella xylostella]
MESLQQVTSSGTNLAMPEDGAGQGSSNEGRGRIRSGTGTPLGLRIGSLFLSWAEVSDINFLSDSQIQQICLATKSRRTSQRGLSISFVPSQLLTELDDKMLTEVFHENVTTLMNEEQYWGCFYIFPELYKDQYSPTVKIRGRGDIPALVDGVLTVDMVSIHLSYLKRTPIVKDFVYIKLNLASLHLVNIDVLKNFRYIVWLDLSSNYLTDVTVLAHMPCLQHLSVSYNRLSSVLEYSPAQHYLTEVYYKYNALKIIRDLTDFWSITVLDLSHNNIKSISGLENLHFLRHLDLAFNHIKTLENLNNLRLLWLDLSYNNISLFEISDTAA